MNYHNILHDDMRNGEGLRVTLFVSGCNHYCPECQNPQTWDSNSGITFDEEARQEILEQLSKDYISGITFSGGDPLYSANLHIIFDFICGIKRLYPDKTIWLYTGYNFDSLLASSYSEDKFRIQIIKMCDVVVDGEYDKNLSDIKYHWAGSTNQRVIDVKKTIENNMNIVLLEE